MPKQWENNELHEFISNAIDDFISWDVVLHFARSPESVESAGSLSKLTGKQENEIDDCLNRLVEQKVLQRVRNGDQPVYLPAKKIKNSELLLRLNECLADREQRIKLLSVALETIRDKKHRRKRRS
jgi:hypothetical protein